MTTIQTIELWIFGAFIQIVPNEVVAWMPLPPCYEPQEGSKE